MPVCANRRIPLGSRLQYVNPVVHITETAYSFQLRRQGTTAQSFVSLQGFPSTAGRVLQKVSLEKKMNRRKGTHTERALGKLQQGLVRSHSVFGPGIGSPCSSRKVSHEWLREQ